MQSISAAKDISVCILIVLTLSMVCSACGDSGQPEQTTAQTVTGNTETPTATELDDIRSDNADQGDPGDTEPYARTEGRWSIDGADGTAAIEMDGKGGFTAYYASGTEEYTGYLDYVDEYGDGNGIYGMYDLSDTLIMGFYFDSKTRFHVGNDDDPAYNPVYIKLGTLPPGFVYAEIEDYRYSGSGDPAKHMSPRQAAYILYEEALADIFEPGAYSDDNPIRITLLSMDDEGYRFAVGEQPDRNPFHVG